VDARISSARTFETDERVVRVIQVFPVIHNPQAAQSLKLNSPFLHDFDKPKPN